MSHKTKIMYEVIVVCTILLLCVIDAHAGSFHGKDIDLNKMTKRGLGELLKTPSKFPTCCSQRSPRMQS